MQKKRKLLPKIGSTYASNPGLPKNWVVRTNSGYKKVEPVAFKKTPIAQVHPKRYSNGIGVGP